LARRARDDALEPPQVSLFRLHFCAALSPSIPSGGSSFSLSRQHSPQYNAHKRAANASFQRIEFLHAVSLARLDNSAFNVTAP